jgi:hypothetical protein
MTITHDLLARGYFPKELPPPFQTEDFADRVLGSIGPLPDSFGHRGIRARACQHNFARVGALRRQLSIPNPVTQYQVSVLIGRHWPRLERVIKRSRLSQSAPIPGSLRAFPVPTTNLVALRAENRATARHVLTSDVSRFYHSIYTHGIAWAVHGKAKAKTNRRNTLLGNALDTWVRNGQDGQTMGIPIGPDTSLIIAELILAAVDRQLVRKLPRLRGFRFMDDYELTFTTRGHAELALSHLQEALAEYELALNADKTAIDELPCLLDPEWKTSLRDFRFRNRLRSQATDLVTYFDRAFRLSRESPEKSVLSYAVRRLRSVTVWPDNWPLLENLLYQCLLTESGTFAPILQLLALRHSQGGAVDTVKLGHVMNMQIVHHGPRGHGSEVAWALWAMLSFRLRIVPAAAKVLENMSDSVVALLALHARDEGLFIRVLDVEGWRGFLSTEDLYGPQWLLAYEASVKGWLASSHGPDHIQGNENFAWLRAIGVEFYDTTRILDASTQPGTGGDGLLHALDEVSAVHFAFYQEDTAQEDFAESAGDADTADADETPATVSTEQPAEVSDSDF